MAAQSSILTHIARPYAAALFELAREQGQLEDVERGLADLARMAGESPEFTRFLRSPVIGADAKARAIEEIMRRSGAGGTVTNFVRLVAENGRLFALLPMVAIFQEMAAAARGEVRAEVTSAEPLSTEQVRDLADTLKARIGKTVTLNQHVDPSLIGGLVVRVGSRMIDSSLKTKLAAMKVAMKEVG